MPEQTWQPIEAAAIDTFIDEVNPAVNYGGNAALEVRSWGANQFVDTLMLWDLSSIARGSTIEIATLFLWLTAFAGNENIAITRLLPANAAWTEGGCTWNTMDGANAWAGGAGCAVRGTDIALTNLWSGTVVAAPPVWVQYDLAPSEFQIMLDSGNYGFKIYYTDRTLAVNRSHIFASATAVAAQRPTLYVRWIEPTGRLVEYTFDVWDPLQRVIGRDGHEVQPNEIRADKWGKLLGFRSPSSKKFADLTDGPDHFYISGVTSDGEMVRITPDDKLFADMLLKRITRG